MDTDTSRTPDAPDDAETDDDADEQKTPFAPKKDGTALGDTNEHSDADA